MAADLGEVLGQRERSDVLNEDQYEKEHVHDVYEEIASHFSATRYKPWPIVEKFLNERTPGSIGLDIGCGNGKYLAVNKNIFIVGSDRSTNLAQIATQHHPHEALVADILALPHQNRQFDFAISIAVVHHLSTSTRRIAAISEILASLKPGIGRALIYVWALEQRSSRRGWDEGDEQDVMVPWVRKGSKPTEKSISSVNHNHDRVSTSQDQTFLRYYHLYRKGELENDVETAGGAIVDSGYEKDNWWAIVRASR